MKTAPVWVVICLFLIISIGLASCGGTATSIPTSLPSLTSTQLTTSQSPTTAAVSTQANWWDKFGEPQYGGTITLQAGMIFPVWDPWQAAPANAMYMYERLAHWNWTLDRNTWPMNSYFVPAQYQTGWLAESWERIDPQTLVFHIRQGVHWQNKAPLNGREFTANDVREHYNRFLGLGGYSQPSALAGWLSLTESVTATDNYTLVVKFKEPSVAAMYQFFDMANEHLIEPPEVAKETKLSAAGPGPSGSGEPSGSGAPSGPGGPSGPASATSTEGFGDWHNAIGTGAWILDDFVSGSSLTFNKNPDYWGYDERYPQNKLPYADTLKVLIIPDTSTALAALRTGKIDIMTGLNLQQSVSLAKTNPEIMQSAVPEPGDAIEFRCDKSPFTDIRVREALQMSIDRTTIAMTYYGGKVDGTPCAMMSPTFKGYSFAYEDWSQELKDEYNFNPTKAKQLLAEAGYPDGFKTDVVAPANADIDLLQVIKANFKDIGVDMDIQVMDSMAFRNFVSAMKHDQMTYGPGSGLTDNPANCLNARYSKEKFINTAGVNDPGYDELYIKFENATDENEMAKAVRDCDKYIAEHHWALYTFGINTYAVYQPYLKGYSGDGTGGDGVPHCARWWVDQNLKKSLGN